MSLSTSPFGRIGGGRPALRVALALGLLGFAAASPGGEPDPKTYWDVKDVRPGMKGVGQTVMVGTKLEEFRVEILGVMKDVSPGRDMVLARLSGCNLEHSGIIQGMSGSPVYIDGKLLGAVAYGWEFAKDPIAGITPFSQMVQYVRSNDKKLAAEAREGAPAVASAEPVKLEEPWELDRIPSVGSSSGFAPGAVSGGGLAGMRPIATPLAASGFSPRSLALLAEKLGPLGMAPMAGGAAQEDVIQKEGDRPLGPGSPLSVAMVTGDFDLSGIGTVTHVEGNRVYGFGHPMMGLGSCELPMMTGYIHTVYPRASVSMKMGSPLKTVGVLDTDVSTAVAGRVGPKPDMLPMTVKAKVGRYSDPRTYNVKIVREPNLLPMMVMSVLTNAIDTEGNLPDELDGAVLGHDLPEGPSADRGPGHPERPEVLRGDGPVDAVQPGGEPGQHPRPQPDGGDPDRADRMRGGRHGRPEARGGRGHPAAFGPPRTGPIAEGRGHDQAVQGGAGDGDPGIGAPARPARGDV